MLLDLLIHLRLPFQIALSAIFLWGVFAASGEFGPRTLLAWAAFTVGLSGGATAFNSYYDRDRGAVTGLLRPPPVSAALLPFSLAVLLAGLVAACVVSASVAAVYALAALLLVLYSHPVARTKRRPLASMATVSLASGALTCLAGALSAGEGASESAALRIAIATLGSTMVVAGFYPLTQLGQVDEDRARGDRTFVVAHGRDAAFRVALPLVAASGALSVGLTIAVYGWAPAAGLTLALGVVGERVLRWRRDASADSSARSDALAYATSAAHAVVVLARALSG